MEVAISPIIDDAHETRPEMSTVIVDPWINVVSEFDAGEKLQGKKKGRFFQSEWFEKYESFLSP